MNCGLTEKYFDLALGTDVKSAKVTINGKKATYDYADIIDKDVLKIDDGELDGIVQKDSSGNTPYTLYLYKSDYNFRIQDYITDTKRRNKK